MPTKIHRGFVEVAEILVKERINLLDGSNVKYLRQKLAVEEEDSLQKGP